MAQPNHQPDESPIEPGISNFDAELHSFYVRAQYDFTSPDASALAFVQGDIIEVLTQLPSGWWDGLLNGVRGWFPSNYVERISEEEVEALIADMEGDEVEEHGVEILPNGQTRAIVHDEVNINPRLRDGEPAASTSQPSAAQELGLAQGIEIDDDDADWLRREMERDVGFDDLARGIMDSEEYGEEIEGNHREESQQGHERKQEPGASSSKDSQKEEEVEGDFWVPSMTPDGQVSCHFLIVEAELRSTITIPRPANPHGSYPGLIQATVHLGTLSTCKMTTTSSLNRLQPSSLRQHLL